MTVQVCVGVEEKCALLGVSELYIIQIETEKDTSAFCKMQLVFFTPGN